MSWFNPFQTKGKTPSRRTPEQAPPEWTPAPEQSHDWGLFHEATDSEFQSAEAFCAQHPVEPPKLLPSNQVERIDEEGCRAWTIEHPRSSRFTGQIVRAGAEKTAAVTRIATTNACGDVCLFSNLPIMAGLYEIHGKSGVYYEITVKKMRGIIAIGEFLLLLVKRASHRKTGTACRPYPDWRFPGWNRCSVGLHLDDMRKFFEDPNGGRDYDPLLSSFSEGDVIGCGYDFAASSVFFTYNGRRLTDAFGGVYVPRTKYDVYVAIGLVGECDLEVNFGGELFTWKEGNEWAWRVEGHVGRLSVTSSSTAPAVDGLPTYDEVRRRH
ncbi:hypothetical protein NM688_g2028 [Phlebia brevispora]|uniref:Uncharacterized protein n=1 Tax=Phlebia brevispora TaxID=194682 RepID=A0ACC1TA21_9APHY|nr:hypothetical protein NM688_g2028 [Phlebia brevispora]